LTRGSSFLRDSGGHGTGGELLGREGTSGLAVPLVARIAHEDGDSATGARPQRRGRLTEGLAITAKKDDRVAFVQATSNGVWNRPGFRDRSVYWVTTSSVGAA